MSEYTDARKLAAHLRANPPPLSRIEKAAQKRAQRMREEIAAIRKGGYAPASAARLIAKAKHKYACYQSASDGQAGVPCPQASVYYRQLGKELAQSLPTAQGRHITAQGRHIGKPLKDGILPVSDRPLSSESPSGRRHTGCPRTSHRKASS